MVGGNSAAGKRKSGLPTLGVPDIRSSRRCGIGLGIQKRLISSLVPAGPHKTANRRRQLLLEAHAHSVLRRTGMTTLRNVRRSIFPGGGDRLMVGAHASV